MAFDPIQSAELNRVVTALGRQIDERFTQVNMQVDVIRANLQLAQGQVGEMSGGLTSTQGIAEQRITNIDSQISAHAAALSEMRSYLETGIRKELEVLDDRIKVVEAAGHHLRGVGLLT